MSLTQKDAQMLGSIMAKEVALLNALWLYSYSLLFLFNNASKRLSEKSGKPLKRYL